MATSYLRDTISGTAMETSQSAALYHPTTDHSQHNKEVSLCAKAGLDARWCHIGIPPSPYNKRLCLRKFSLSVACSPRLPYSVPPSGPLDIKGAISPLRLSFLFLSSSLQLLLPPRFSHLEVQTSSHSLDCASLHSSYLSLITLPSYILSYYVIEYARRFWSS